MNGCSPLLKCPWHSVEMFAFALVHGQELAFNLKVVPEEIVQMPGQHHTGRAWRYIAAKHFFQNQTSGTCLGLYNSFLSMVPLVTIISITMSGTPFLVPML
ncbi:hypothetical protein [Scytonema sp. NUACC21]